MDFRASGKLLITGEYAVLKGAKALALPTQLGQRLLLKPNPSRQLNWQVYNHEEDLVYDEFFGVQDNIFYSENEPDAYTQTILKMLNYALKKGVSQELILSYNYEFYQEFKSAWGLGTSSTLICLLSQVWNIDPFDFNTKIFGGSGYDIAVGINSTPIHYQLLPEGRNITEVYFNPPFKEDLSFVYLGKKQDSGNEIRRFNRIVAIDEEEWVKKVSKITEKITVASNLEEFEKLLIEHGELISNQIGLPRIQKEKFEDYNGVIKSLGAWGGDFILVTRLNENKDYFKNKGLKEVFSFKNMILHG